MSSPIKPSSTLRHSTSSESLRTATTEVDDSSHSFAIRAALLHPNTSSNDEDNSSLDTQDEEQDDSKKVRFSTLTIREYARCLGDNPGVRVGAPMSLEWNPQYEYTPIDVDLFESARGQRRSRDELLIPPMTRDNLMRASGYSRKEIMECTRQANLIKGRRRRTLETMRMAPAHELVQTAVRGFRNAVVNREEKKLERQALTNYLARDQERLQKATERARHKHAGPVVFDVEC